MPKIVQHDGDDYHIQLDVEGHDRKKSNGSRRLMLTKLEIKEIKKRQLAGKALTLILERSLKIPEIAEELGVSQDLLSRAAMNDTELRKGIIQQAVAMFLDLDTARSRKQMAKELGLGLWQFNHLIESDEFAEIYDDHFAELTNDPTLRAVQTKLVEEMLPKAVKTIDSILSNVKAPATVRLKAALETLRLAGVQAATPAASDRQELSEFLSKHNINITQVNVGEEKKVEVVEGEVKDV